MTAIVVYHEGYGCDTGCCGHRIESEDGTISQFVFNHPWDEDALAWVKTLITDELGQDHVADLDWDNCIIEEY